MGERTLCCNRIYRLIFLLFFCLHRSFMIPEGKNCKPDWRTDLVGGKGGKEQNQGTNCVRRHVSDALSPPPFPILLKVREKGKGRKRRIFFFPPHCWLDGLIGFLVPGPGFYVHKA